MTAARHECTNAHEEDTHTRHTDRPIASVLPASLRYSSDASCMKRYNLCIAHTHRRKHMKSSFRVVFVCARHLVMYFDVCLLFPFVAKQLFSAHLCAQRDFIRHVHTLLDKISLMCDSPSTLNKCVCPL